MQAEPDRTAFLGRFHGEEGYRRVARREWEELSEHIARGLRDRFAVDRGTKVAWLLDNRSAGEALSLYQAVHRLGAVNVPISTRLARPEIEHILRHSEASVCLFDDATAERSVSAIEATLGLAAAVVVGDASGSVSTTLGELVELGRRAAPCTAARIDEHTDAVILYTSGTTGRPKGVLLSQANVVASGIAWADALRLGPDDVFQAPFPIFSGAGLHYTAMAALFAGAAFIVDDHETEHSLRMLEREQTTVCAAVPSIYQFWLESPVLATVNVDSVRTLAYGGASMPPSVITRLRGAFPNAGLMQTYGLTEAGPGGTYLPEEYALRFLGSIGTRTAGRFTQVRVVDAAGRDVGPGTPGELLLRGASVMKEYFNDPEATSAAMPDGWLRSGDVVRFDENGALYHLDRKKDIIIRGGFNIASSEVESAILNHPSIVDAAVVGRPHDKLGEEVVAFVVARPGDEVTAEQLLAHCRDLIADFKLPRDIRFCAELPRNAAGKVLKQTLREQSHRSEASVEGES